MKALNRFVSFFSFLLVALVLSAHPLTAVAQEQATPSASVSQAEGVNINTASAEEIAATLTGIGPAKAAAIVAWREQNGAFTHIDQLLEVKGIGRATLDKNAHSIAL